MSVLEIPHTELCDELFRMKRMDDIIDDDYLLPLANYIKSAYNIEDERLPDIQQKLKRFVSTFKGKLRVAFRDESRFRNIHKYWLSRTSNFDFSRNSSSVGRPRLEDFDASSPPTKCRRLQEILDIYSEEEVKKAFYKILRNSGKQHLINEIENLLENSMDTVNPEQVNPFTGDECIALMEDARLSKWQYETIRKQVQGKHVNIFQIYRNLVFARSLCYPPEGSIIITEKGARVILQALLDHTCSRILQIPEVRLQLSEAGDHVSLTMTSKWGCDGASDQSRYKQKFSDGTLADDSIFMISLVPLTLEFNSISGRKIIWNNPNCGSTRYCRLISFEYAKETAEKTREEVERVSSEIDSLVPSVVEIPEQKLEINHNLHLTMVDGKVCQALTNTQSSSTCTICGANPSEMNKLNEIAKRTENSDNFEYGLSTLHAWIRLMECIIHIAYRLSFCKWRASKDEQKEQMKEEKKRIQEEFKSRTGLLIDYPKQGAGSTNDGNTARRFFSDPELAAEITGVDQELIQRFSVILQVGILLQITLIA